MSYLCLKRDLKEGEYATFSQFGHEVIAKNDKGKITVAKNACSHRGFKVASCPNGRGAIKCQYHGTRFEYEQPYSHYEFGEFIFLPQYLGKSDPLTKISSEIGEEFGSHVQFVDAPFHLWIQNTMDPHHLKYAHKESFAELFDGSLPENVYLSEFESSYTMRIKDEVVERYQKHFPEASDYFFHYAGFPSLSVTSFLDIFYSVESAIPDGSGCRVHTRFFSRRSVERNNLLERLALDANKKILAEDKELVEKWAINYKYDPNIRWMPGESRIKRYADEIRARGLE